MVRQLLTRDEGDAVDELSFAYDNWTYLGFVATQMDVMSSVLAMPMTSTWSPVQTTMMVTMWVLMMAAMMLPSGVPMVLAYDRMDQGSADGQDGSTALFVGGYVVVWSAFAVAAAGLQWVLHNMALVNGMGVATQGAGGPAIGRSWGLPVLAGEEVKPRSVPHTHGLLDDLVA